MDTSRRTSSRVKQPSLKAREMADIERASKERTLYKEQGKWVLEMKATRAKLKEFCSEDQLNFLRDKLHKCQDRVVEAYESIRQSGWQTPEMLNRVDSVCARTRTVLDTMSSKNTNEETYDAVSERSKIRMNLCKEDNRSVFGSSISEASSTASQLSIKRAEAAAEVAAKQVELDMLEEEEAQKARLSEAEETHKKFVEAQQVELRRIEAEKEIRVAEARLRVLEESELDVELGGRKDHPDRRRTPACDAASSVKRSQLNPLSARYQPRSLDSRHSTVINPEPTIQHTSAPMVETSDIVKALADSLALNRLPVPEPSVFNGNPMHYTDWKMSFKMLIDARGIAATDRLYYLRKYVGGEVKQELENFFMTNSESAYVEAWHTLDNRYGNQYVIADSFRQRLSKWQKISPRDNQGIQRFGDFLKSCLSVMPHVPGLHILDDPHQNKIMLSKLPDNIIVRWNRRVVDSQMSTGLFPTFKDFVNFITYEALVECNPVTSLHAVKSLETKTVVQRQEQGRTRSSVLSTATNDQHKAKQTRLTDGHRNALSQAWPNKDRQTRVATCICCSRDGHFITGCKEFAKRSIQEKHDFVTRNQLCFGCLRKGHFSRECRGRHTCGKCKARHPTCLHREQTDPESHQIQKTYSDKKTYPDESRAVSHGVVQASSATAMIVPVWVSTTKDPSKEVLVYALLDTQSDTTFIIDDVANCLDVESAPVRLKLSTMTSTNAVLPSRRLHGLQVRGYSSATRMPIKCAYTKDIIPLERSAIPTSETARSWPHLASMANEMPPLRDCSVGMLIGYDCPTAITPCETIIGNIGEPCALKTILGWSVVGSSSASANRNASGFAHRISVKELPVITPYDILNVLERDFSDLQNVGRCVSQEDCKFLEIMEQTIKRDGSGHYEMALPFKGDRPIMPDNRGAACIRLHHLKRKFNRDACYKADYVRFMEDVITRGDAERVPNESHCKGVWYIPHHGVYHPQKPGKIRVVFDCSAKCKGTSLNDHLLTGPDLTNTLIGVLCRFRQYPIAVVCDIEKMFHQFHVLEDDRDYLRFLWWEGDTDTTPTEYRMKVHIFGAASSPGCANYGLKHIARSHGEATTASAFIQRNFYVDDGLLSVQSSAAAIKIIKEAQSICKTGRLCLHKFVSNSREVMDSIPPTERNSSVKDVDLDYEALPVERVLGIRWCTESDRFGFHVQARSQPLSRRGILSTVASIYDPLGFIAPYVLVGKQILQKMCSRGVGWDDPLPDDLNTKWEDWRNDIVNLENVHVSRCFMPNGFGEIVSAELHHFSDASNDGYGQCSYLRLLSESQVHCSLVASKARVAPIKLVTIPRLELTAALTSVRMSSMLKEELDYKIDREYFWTDSRVVLGYVSNDARRFHVFVANRITQIKQGSSSEQWHYVETSRNPADHASRGASVTELVNSNWFSGPPFLWNQELVANDEVVPSVGITDPEVKATCAMAVIPSEEFDILDRVFKFSNWSKLVKAIARLKRLAKGIRITSLTSVMERREAENFIIRAAQSKTFAKELGEMRRSSSGPLKRNVLHRLEPFLHEGLIRVGGRLKHASLSFDVKHPIILPKDGHVTQLVIAHYHEMALHQGKGMTLNTLRSNGIYVIGGSRLIASYIHKCVQCRKFRRPLEEQRMADLPQERVDVSPPFTYSGVDCFGPFYTKQGRKTYKRYGLLFTCMSSRAVHIEMIVDMSTDAFINGLRCFIALRGAVRQLRSDQGSNFVGAKNELREALKEISKEKLEAYLADKQCDFIMNAPCSSHVGGVWERQIRTARSILTALLDQHANRLDDSSLRTFFYEATYVMNSRPLTTENLNDPKGPEPLTPNHLLTMKSAVALPPPGDFVNVDLYARKRWRRVQYLTEQFWSRWKDEYLSAICQRQKWHTRRRNLSVGDIVIIRDDEIARNVWPLAKVTETTEDKTGLVRKVKVVVGNRGLDNHGKPTKKASVLERPVQKLVLLLENV